MMTFPDFTWRRAGIVAYLAIITLAIIAIGAVQENQGDRITKVERSPCSEAPRSKECRDVLNAAVQGLSPKASCAIVEKAGITCRVDKNGGDKGEKGARGAAGDSGAGASSGTPGAGGDPTVPAPASPGAVSPGAPPSGGGGSDPPSPGPVPPTQPPTPPGPGPGPSPPGDSGLGIDVCVNNPLAPVCVKANAGENGLGLGVGKP